MRQTDVEAGPWQPGAADHSMSVAHAWSVAASSLDPATAGGAEPCTRSLGRARACAPAGLGPTENSDGGAAGSGRHLAAAARSRIQLGAVRRGVPYVPH